MKKGKHFLWGYDVGKHFYSLAIFLFFFLSFDGSEYKTNANSGYLPTRLSVKQNWK